MFGPASGTVGRDGLDCDMSICGSTTVERPGTGKWKPGLLIDESVS